MIRILALCATFCAICAAAIASAPTATINGQSCPLLTRSFPTTPLQVDCTSGFWICDPGQTVYRATYELLVPATCSNDRVMRSGFEQP